MSAHFNVAFIAFCESNGFFLNFLHISKFDITLRQCNSNYIAVASMKNKQKFKVTRSSYFSPIPLHETEMHEESMAAIGQSVWQSSVNSIVSFTRQQRNEFLNNGYLISHVWEILETLEVSLKTHFEKNRQQTKNTFTQNDFVKPAKNQAKCLTKKTEYSEISLLVAWAPINSILKNSVEGRKNPQIRSNTNSSHDWASSCVRVKD